MNDYVIWTGKYVGAAILVPLAALLIYLLAGVLQVYIIAWIVALIGWIFQSLPARPSRPGPPGSLSR